MFRHLWRRICPYSLSAIRLDPGPRCRIEYGKKERLEWAARGCGRRCHRKSGHFRGWAGGSYHAEEFDLKAVNEILERMRWPVRHRR